MYGEKDLWKKKICVGSFSVGFPIFCLFDFHFSPLLLSVLGCGVDVY